MNELKHSDPRQGRLTSEPRHGRLSLVMFLILLVFFLYLGLRMIAGYVLDLFMGAILAILFDFAYEWLRDKKLRPVVAAVIVTFAIFALILGPLLAFAVLAIREGIGLTGQLMQSPPNIDLGGMANRIYRLGHLEFFFSSPAAFQAQARGLLQTIGKTVTGYLLSLISTVPAMLLDLILALVTCYYFLVDGTRLRSWLQNKVPLDPEVRTGIIAAFKDTSVSTIWSAMAGALVQAAFLVVAFAATGVPALFLAGGAAFILAWVPIVGSIPVWAAGVIYLWINHSLAKVVIVVIFGVLAGVADNVVRPWVLKGRGDMHALVGLFAIFGGINMFGIFGVFYGPILAAIVIALLQVWPTVGKRFGLSFDSGVDLPPSGE